MFIDEIKIYAHAGHGGKGAVAFSREKYRPKGGPSGGNGGRGGDVILEADHDLNNLIAQYFQPRLIAPDGQGGMGKGMDGYAGKDLVIKVPCGTLVWQLPSDPVADDPEGMEEKETSRKAARIRASGSARPVIRSARGARAMEIDLAREGADGTGSGASADEVERELVADLTEHGQRFILCKGGGGTGQPKLRHRHPPNAALRPTRGAGRGRQLPV